MPKIIVCGDSFMTPVVTYPKTHFSELLADRLDYELIAYSRGGMSNGGIAIQINTAIQEKPDLILVGTTAHDRIEFSALEPEFNKNHFTVKDIQYKHPDSLSSHYTWLNENTSLISTNLKEIVDKFDETSIWSFNFAYCDQPEEKKKAINDWFEYLYHPGWKLQTDSWMMYALFHKLHGSKIPYIICLDLINVAKTCPWLENSRHDVSSSIRKLIWPIPDWKKYNLPGYHTFPATQERIADFLLNHIKVYFKDLPNV